MKKKTAVVTGGSAGIGFAISKVLIENDYYVVIGSKNKYDLRSLPSTSYEFIKMDATDESGHEKLAHAAIKAQGKLDLYINNVGRSMWKF